jgi:hypothetical protein
MDCASAKLHVVETGIRQEHLYYACKLFARYYYEPGDNETNASATGFIVESPERQKFGLVTNRHFIEPGWSGEPLYQGTSLTKLRASIWLDVSERIEVDVVSAPIFHDDPTVDACILPITSDTLVNVEMWLANIDPTSPVPKPHRWSEGVENGCNAKVPLQYYVTWKLLDISEWYWKTLDPGETLFFPGYPAWHDKSQDRPIIRTGAIVSDPQANWRQSKGGPKPGDGSSQVLFDAFSTDGNSGSPVFVGQRGIQSSDTVKYTGYYRHMILAGINAGHIENNKAQHVGLSRMHKVSVIVDLARKL